MQSSLLQEHLFSRQFDVMCNVVLFIDTWLGRTYGWPQNYSCGWNKGEGILLVKLLKLFVLRIYIKFQTVNSNLVKFLSLM